MRCLELNENKEKNARRMTAVNPWKRHEQYALQQTSVQASNHHCYTAIQIKAQYCRCELRVRLCLT